MRWLTVFILLIIIFDSFASIGLSQIVIPTKEMKKSEPNFIFSRPWFKLSIGVIFILMMVMICEGESYGIIKKKHVILLGASVGHDWNIESLPQRLGQNSGAQRYRLEFVANYNFDKTQTLKEILKRNKNRPDAIILKECAAYFPGDLAHYQDLMKGWIKECKDAKVIPIPATVLPVTKQKNITAKMKDAVKIVLGRPPSSAQLEQITQYNDWIKAYANHEKLKILDLEIPVRVSLNDRSLRMDLHSGDGLHLNRSAYDLLDKAVLPALDQAIKIK